MRAPPRSKLAQITYLPHSFQGPLVPDIHQASESASYDGVGGEREVRERAQLSFFRPPAAVPARPDPVLQVATSLPSWRAMAVATSPRKAGRDMALGAAREKERFFF